MHAISATSAGVKRIEAQPRRLSIEITNKLPVVV